MPPTMGTAMRRITSEPAPSLQRIGNRPAMMATTVIILGRTRSTAPAMIAARKSSRVNARPSSRAACSRSFKRLVEIDEHHDAGLGGDAGERDEADGNGDAHIVAEPPHEPGAADERKGHREHDDERLGEAAEIEIEQHEDEEQRRRDRRRAAWPPRAADIRTARSIRCDSRAAVSPARRRRARHRSHSRRDRGPARST